MNLTLKNSFWGYFNFYYRITGNSLLLYLGLSILVSLMDGLGLAMFIPLLQFVGNPDKTVNSEESLGQLHYIVDFVRSLGFELTLTTILGMLVFMFTCKGLLRFIQLSFYARMRHLFILKVRKELLHRLEGLSYSGFLELDAGKIQNTFTSEVNRLFVSMTAYFTAAQNFFMLSTYICLAFLANYQFALMVLVGSLLSNFIYRKIYKRTKKASIELTKRASSANNFIIQAIHNFKYLKSTNTFTRYAEMLQNVVRKYERLNRSMGKIKAVSLSIKEPIIITIVCAVILLQTNLMGTSLNTILLSLFLFYRALNFLVQVQNDWQTFIENIGGMYAISASAHQMTESRELMGTAEFAGVKKQIHLRNVDLYYDRVKALDKINIKIPAKKTIALIGESGSGKTTAANILAGLFTPKSGEILIDDTPLINYNLNSYRDKIGYISQESVVFNDTIFNNITFWADPTPENKERFDEVLEMASLKDFIKSLPDKEFTNLGDNGLLISGGQKQRISIARELFKKCEILILDEATSALDSETERVIQENIEKLHGRYTMIVIAHRLSTIKQADIIYLLENGRVSASGTFDEMINTSVRFKKMVSFQSV
ncbi:MAG: ABC transporter ATP-binding protein [Chitinophagaceae bacterium]|nr:ABC transporter ATP-binding protein [Chitinophagaceae bacterium]